MNKRQEQRIIVYAATYPFEVLSDYVPQLRQSEINRSTNIDVVNCKYYTFKLLEIALANVYNADFRNVDFIRNSNGKWQCSVCQLSITHSDKVVAVAVSDLPVGVDAERIDPDRFSDKLQARIFTQNEAVAAKKLQDYERRLYANRLWTVKEAAFKLGGKTAFIANQTDTFEFSDRIMTVTVGNNYYLTVASTSKDFEVEFRALNVSLSN